MYIIAFSVQCMVLNSLCLVACFVVRILSNMGFPNVSTTEPPSSNGHSR